MALMDEITPELAVLERELEDYRQRVDAARHNPWHGGDVLDPEYRHLLSSLAESPSAGQARADRRNPWREALTQLG